MHQSIAPRTQQHRVLPVMVRNADSSHDPINRLDDVYEALPQAHSSCDQELMQQIIHSATMVADESPAIPYILCTNEQCHDESHSMD